MTNIHEEEIMFSSKITLRVLTLIVLAIMFTAVSVTTVYAKGKPAKKPKALKAQTVCPVMGGKINKSLYYDYQGKRIYVCCPPCLGELEKDPEKYIKKLKSLGQAAEAIVPIPAKDDSSMQGMDMKGMDVKGMHMMRDTSGKQQTMPGDSATMKGMNSDKK